MLLRDGLGRAGGRTPPLHEHKQYVVGVDSTSLALRSKFAKQTSHPPDPMPSPVGEGGSRRLTDEVYNEIKINGRI